MDRKETLALYAKGRDAWNDWARKLVAKRVQMQSEGKWEAEDGLYPEPKNEETRTWLAAAYIDFSTREKPQKFPRRMDFTGYHFPTSASFVRDGIERW